MSVATETNSFDSQELNRKPWFLIPLLGGLFGSVVFILGLLLTADSLTTQQKTDWIMRAVPVCIGFIVVGLYMFLRYGGAGRVPSFVTVFLITLFLIAVSSNQVAHLVLTPLRWFD